MRNFAIAILLLIAGSAIAQTPPSDAVIIQAWNACKDNMPASPNPKLKPAPGFEDCPYWRALYDSTGAAAEQRARDKQAADAAALAAITAREKAISGFQALQARQKQ